MRYCHRTISLTVYNHHTITSQTRMNNALRVKNYKKIVVRMVNVREVTD